MGADKQMVSYVHGGNVHAWARERGGELADFLDYSANINPLGLPDSVRKAITQSVDLVIHYPDAQASSLKEAISTYYHVDVERITTGNGAVELLYVLAHTLRPKRVLIPAPTFSEYERATAAAGAAIEYAYLSADNGFVFDIDYLCRRIKKVDMAFIGNPNNPTGTLVTNGQIQALLQAAKQHETTIVVDESFMDFMNNDQEYTCRSLLRQYDNLVIVHSLTKFYAIPGLRLGFAFAHPDLTVKLHHAKDPWNVNLLAQTAGVAALADAEYQIASRETVKQEKDRLFAGLNTLAGIKPFLPSVNYILLDISQSGHDAQQLRQKLAEKNVLIRDCSNYPGLSPRYVRVAVKRNEQNKILLHCFKQVLR
ncbi:threonine-phosphate decarboxylase CobD [Sporomusa acidovorans]|uniref:threonine-phosphate decarboxylase n=1 Tax=Sporomusa acidovorans (strain ATCC 49682 / DSM 3132 / Mol) TaxID=1123286 RepID=A0ABZ3J114_SPOA4|nr:threonine-phosphate decarboxylase CobD [Sporomusa acidovorans]OZC15062.1 threonine-phosphate decarboxylase [Sporomusa acidovorans DSM 3132]SDE84880.1 L-threonine O-3-phosphate decarboxylase [Sporomusa acidovorans]